MREPAGAYWHTEQEVMSGAKLVSTDNIWTDASGNGLARYRRPAIRDW